MKGDRSGTVECGFDDQPKPTWRKELSSYHWIVWLFFSVHPKLQGSLAFRNGTCTVFCVHVLAASCNSARGGPRDGWKFWDFEKRDEGVAQLVLRQLAVRQARVRFSAPNPMEASLAERRSDEKTRRRASANDEGWNNAGLYSIPINVKSNKW
jgi:hypothetical protein